MNPLDQRHPGPSIRDWGLLAIGIVFVVSGIVTLPHDRNVGVVTLTFFTPCAVLFARRIARKLRFRRPPPLRAEIVGGVPIRRSRIALWGTGALLFAMGVTLIVFGRSYGLVFWVLAWVIALAGVAVLIGVAVGRFGRDYLQFDPAGVTLGYRPFALIIPWDAIASIRSGEYRSNPILAVGLREEPGLIVTPPEMHASAKKQLNYNEIWFGARVILFPSQFGLDLPLLMTALARYVDDPSSRRELALKYIPQRD